MGKTRRPVRTSLAPGSLRVAVIVTVFNEQDNILGLVDLLNKQTFTPVEIIIVDGGSTDSTYSLLKQKEKNVANLRTYQVPGNRSVGRNFAVSHSKSPIIAFTDAGCSPHLDWLEQLVAPFLNTKVTVVSGYYEGLAKNSFQESLTPYVLVMPDIAEKTEFFPSTRSMALRRSVWNESGGFDVRLWHNEDYAFAHWLKKMGQDFFFAPKAIVSWHPRKNLAQSFWMFLRFAIGDTQSGIIRFKVKLVILRYFLFAYLLLLSFEYRPLVNAVFIVFFLYIFWAIAKNYRYVKKPAALFWLPTLQLTSDLAVITGTIIGFLNKK